MFQTAFRPPDQGVETPQRDVTAVPVNTKATAAVCTRETHSELIPTSFMSSEIQGVFCLNIQAAARRSWQETQAVHPPVARAAELFTSNNDCDTLRADFADMRRRREALHQTNKRGNKKKTQTNFQVLWEAETGKVGKLEGSRFWRRLQLSSLQPPAGAVDGQDYSPLIHLASGSWALNSGLNRSSTVSLVSLPGWLSAVKKINKQINQTKTKQNRVWRVDVECGSLSGVKSSQPVTLHRVASPVHTGYKPISSRGRAWRFTSTTVIWLFTSPLFIFRQIKAGKLVFDACVTASGLS